MNAEIAKLTGSIFEKLQRIELLDNHPALAPIKEVLASGDLLKHELNRIYRNNQPLVITSRLYEIQQIVASMAYIGLDFEAIKTSVSDLLGEIEELSLLTRDLQTKIDHE